MQSSEKEKSLYAVLCDLKTPELMEAFFCDLCTPAERKAMSERWQVAKLLHQGALSYRDIHAHTGVSLVTIARVARFLKDESYGGYRHALERKISKNS